MKHDKVTFKLSGRRFIALNGGPQAPRASSRRSASIVVKMPTTVTAVSASTTIAQPYL